MSTWSPADFVTASQLCPPEVITRHLEELHEVTQADALLMLVADERAVLRSLVQGQGPLAQSIATAIANPKPTAELPRWLPDLLSWKNKGARTLRRMRKILDILQACTPTPAAKEALTDRVQWSQMPPSQHQSRARLNVRVLMHKARNNPDLTAAADELLQMVSCTIQASVRIDSSTMLRVDKAMSQEAVDSSSFFASLKLLATMAQEVTSSEAVGIYLRKPGSEIVQLAAFAPDASTFPLAAEYTDLSRNIISESLRLHRPVQSPPAEHGFDWPSNSPHNGPDRHVLLATPIPGPLASPSLPAVGVLVALRIAPDTCPTRTVGPYDAYELALLRNVALRAALLKENWGYSNLVKALHSGKTRTPRGGVADSRRQAVTISRSAVGIERHLPLPYDLKQALPGIAEVLKLAGEQTNSQSVTFRALLPNPDATLEHLHALVRVAAFPEDRLNDRYKILTRQHTTSMSWKALTKGVQVAAPCIGNDEDCTQFIWVRPDTASAYSEPVFRDGRLIGVVNFENRARRGLSGYEQVVQAVASTIANEVSHANLAISRPLLARAIDILDNGHSIASADCTELTKLLRREAASAPSYHAMLGKVHAIDQKSRLLRMPRVHSTANKPMNLGKMLEHLFMSRYARPPVHFGDDFVRDHIPNVEIERALSLSIDAILDNIHRHSRDSLEDILVEVRRDQRAGMDLISILFGSRVVYSMKRASEVNVYRVPLNSAGKCLAETPKDAKPHLGAYIAGEHMRAVGGDVFMVTTGRNSVVTVVELPFTG